MKSIRLLLVLSVFGLAGINILAQTPRCDAQDTRCKIAEFTKRIEEQPGEAESYFGRGGTYADAKDFDRAIDDFTKYISLTSEKKELLVRGYVARAFIYQRKGKYDEAAHDYADAIKLMPQDEQLFFRRGENYTAQGKFGLAIADFDSAISLKPFFLRAYIARGVAFMSNKKYKAAFADFNKVLEIDENNSLAQYHRGIVYGERREPAKALTDLTAYISKGSGDPDLLYCAYQLRGIAAFSLINRDQFPNPNDTRAIDDFTTSITINPTAPSAYELRAIVYRIQKKNLLAESDEKTVKKLKAIQSTTGGSCRGVDSFIAIFDR